MPPSDDMTDFGYRQVAKDEKASLVRQVFTSVAPRYDVMNDLMSLGIHRVWKRIFIQTLQPRPDKRLLDLAGGTGDISLGWLNAGGGPALLTDINPSMLFEGRQRAIAKGRVGAVTCAVVDAEKIPVPDRSVDVVTIAFGLRNCTDKAAVLREARRVLKPGGLFACLEFSHVQIAALSSLYDLWSFQVLPRIGGLVAKDEESYRYLAESIRTFPRAEELTAMMREAGLERCSHRLLSGGIVAIHTGRVL